MSFEITGKLIVKYDTAGVFDVTLIANWPTKADTINVNNYVQVNLCPSNLNVSLLIQGMYRGSGKLNSIIPGHPELCDSITIELHGKEQPYSMVYSSVGVIDTTGSGFYQFQNLIVDSYYIVVKHRNSLETWSKIPVLFNQDTTYFNFIEKP